MVFSAVQTHGDFKWVATWSPCLSNLPNYLLKVLQYKHHHHLNSWKEESGGLRKWASSLDNTLIIYSRLIDLLKKKKVTLNEHLNMKHSLLCAKSMSFKKHLSYTKRNYLIQGIAFLTIPFWKAVPRICAYERSSRISIFHTIDVWSWRRIWRS